ncbi:MAG: ABC transporter permease [Desulfurococcaceae archaeon]
MSAENYARFYLPGELLRGAVKIAFSQLIGTILTMAEMELRRLRHDPLEIVTRAIQPVLWVTVFGVVMARRVSIDVDNYISFIAPGVVLQSATFIALAYGIMLVFERESGILKKLLSSPIPRASVVLGRALAGGIRASTQYIIVLIAASLAGASLTSNILFLLLGYLVVIYVCMGFTAVSILLVSVMKTRERFMGIIGAVSMPLFFASNALYPIDIMPTAIRMFALVNPITYTVNMLRKILLYCSLDISGELVAVTLFFVATTIAAIRVLDKIVE